MGRRLNTVFQRQENGRNFESESCNWRTSFMSSMNELNSFCRSHWKLYPGFKAENGLALDDAWDRFSHLHARSILILLAQASQSQNKKFLFLVVGIKCSLWFLLSFQVFGDDVLKQCAFVFNQQKYRRRETGDEHEEHGGFLFRSTALGLSQRYGRAFNFHQF